MINMYISKLIEKIEREGNLKLKFKTKNNSEIHVTIDSVKEFKEFLLLSDKKSYLFANGKGDDKYNANWEEAFIEPFLRPINLITNKGGILW